MRLLTFFQTFSDIGTVFTAKILGVEAFQAAELEPNQRWSVKVLYQEI
jgi:hypothetical protein